ELDLSRVKPLCRPCCAIPAALFVTRLSRAISLPSPRCSAIPAFSAVCPRAPLRAVAPFAVNAFCFSISAITREVGDLLLDHQWQSPVLVQFRPEPHIQQDFSQFIAISGRNCVTAGFRRFQFGRHAACPFPSQTPTEIANAGSRHRQEHLLERSRSCVCARSVAFESGNALLQRVRSQQLQHRSKSCPRL